jgi:hypothetical protein
MRRGKSPTVNKLRDRQPLKAVINRNMGGNMGKKIVLKRFETCWKSGICKPFKETKTGFQPGS